MNDKIKKSMICKRIGAKVAFYRTLKGLTQDDLSGRCHIGKSTLGRIERGEYAQGLSVITLIENLVGCYQFVKKQNGNQKENYHYPCVCQNVLYYWFHIKS